MLHTMGFILKFNILKSGIFCKPLKGTILNSHNENNALFGCKYIGQTSKLKTLLKQDLRRCL